MLMQVLKEARRLLTPAHGTFALVDALREPGEGLAAYRDRSAEVAETWTLSGEGLASMMQHMRKFDQPQDLAGLTTLAERAGFAATEVFTKGRNICVLVCCSAIVRDMRGACCTETGDNLTPYTDMIFSFMCLKQ